MPAADAARNFHNDDDTVHFHYEEQGQGPHDEVIRLNHKWKGYDLDKEYFLRRLPKVELHVHLDGSFDPAILLAHVHEMGHDILPDEVHLAWDQTKLNVRSSVEACKDVKDFHSLCTCRGKRSLVDMLKCFEIFTPIVRGNFELIERLAYDFVQRQSRQNVVYSEVRYSPHFLSDGAHNIGDDDVKPGPIVDAVTRGLRRGEEDFGVKVNQILCCIAWRPEWAKEVIELAHDRRNDFPCAIVGVDIAAGEDHFNEEELPHLYTPHYEAFQRAQELKLNITIHAGEVGDSTYIRKAVNEYGATRIGHGYRIVHEPHVMEEMKGKNIHFEACPTSSDETGGWKYDEDKGKDWKEHPVIHMVKHGLNVGLNSDDPAVFDTSLTWQYRLAVGKMGLTKLCIVDSLYHSISAAFVSEEDKSLIRSLVDDYL
eukprot:CAMPEP_0204628330 /NCGR_PEP_ID=MMETSP0717-20131115/15552_1 /ASSEMBLY_ACC=CAM_ASM_000666 /TAXON_ID=230516 /ORGANISM="Chaetoceros curvisetus" /LENGTH=425 /DNA_ID=CAMNT_0051644881 /DNA_START=22 /DNA_END=1295 /DNA_ORIENTATION=-